MTKCSNLTGLPNEISIVISVSGTSVISMTLIPSSFSFSIASRLEDAFMVPCFLPFRSRPEYLNLAIHHHLFLQILCCRLFLNQIPIKEIPYTHFKCMHPMGSGRLHRALDLVNLFIS